MEDHSQIETVETVGLNVETQRIVIDSKGRFSFDIPFVQEFPTDTSL